MMARVVESRVLCKSISLIQKVENHQLCLHRTTSVVVMACGLKSKDREAATAFGADQCVHQKIAREAQMTAISLDSFRQAKCWRATQRGLAASIISACLRLIIPARELLIGPRRKVWGRNSAEIATASITVPSEIPSSITTLSTIDF